MNRLPRIEGILIRNVNKFRQKSKELYKQARKRRDKVHGRKLWYCSANLIEDGARVAFIGANPGGGKQARKNDKKYGALSAPYDKSRQYNAWLDDTHWKRKDLQKNVKKAFRLLFGKKQGESVLQSAACFNVVPIRSKDVKKLSTETWDDGVKWCIEVTERVSPRIIVCLGNEKNVGNKKNGRSAWSAFAGKKDRNIQKFKQEQVYGTYRLKRGYIARGKLRGTLLVGLPHLSRVKDMTKLQEAGKRLKIRSTIRRHLTH